MERRKHLKNIEMQFRVQPACAILRPRQMRKTTLEEIIRQTGAASEECYFWGTQSKAELDLLILKNGKRIGYEFKYSDAPKITPSMRIACEDLKLDHLYVIYPGTATFPLSEKITARGLENKT